MTYEIQCRSKYRPDWHLLYLVEPDQGSRPAYFTKKEQAKSTLRILRSDEEQRHRHRPGGRREFRIDRSTGQPVEQGSTDPVQFVDTI